MPDEPDGVTGVPGTVGAPVTVSAPLTNVIV